MLKSLFLTQIQLQRQMMCVSDTQIRVETYLETVESTVLDNLSNAVWSKHISFFF